ncbi:hypothetical protein ACR2YT_27310, partial [Klebsiella pneumoniae]
QIYIYIYHMASSLFLPSYLMASLIIFSVAFTALGRANPSLVVPCNVLKLPSSALTETTFTVPASELKYGNVNAWKPMGDGLLFSTWGADVDNWGYFDVSRLQKGATYGVYYQLTANQKEITNTLILSLELPDGDSTRPAKTTISLVPGIYKKIPVGSFKNSYTSGSMQFRMTSKNPEDWANNLIINSVVIAEEQS